MAAGDNYRERAIECIQAAYALADLERKLTLLELAQRWIDLASWVETTEGGALRGDALLLKPRSNRH
jgi:hypothetical protein